jgi:hypothetical protein
LVLLQSDDVVARYAAVDYLIKSNFVSEIAQRAKELLAVPNDGLRYHVLQAIASTGDDSAAEQVAELVRNPAPSRNFNVLRYHAINALAVCGDATAVEVIAPHTLETARNSTTRAAVLALMKLAERYPECKAAVVRQLAISFPEPEDGVERLVRSHAELVHTSLAALTGREVPFPESYDAAARRDLESHWSAR